MKVSYTLEVATRNVFIARREAKNAEIANCRNYAVSILVEINNLFLAVGLSALSPEEEEVVLNAAKPSTIYADKYNYGPCYFSRPLNDHYQLQFQLAKISTNYVRLEVAKAYKNGKKYKSSHTMSLESDPEGLREYLAELLSYEHEGVEYYD